MRSKFFKLDARDLFNGLVMVVLGAIIGFLDKIFTLGRLPNEDEWKAAFFLGIGAGIAYMSKNLLSNSNGDFFEKEKTTEE